jgi:hypothetical protein
MYQEDYDNEAEYDYLYDLHEDELKEKQQRSKEYWEHYDCFKKDMKFFDVLSDRTYKRQILIEKTEPLPF